MRYTSVVAAVLRGARSLDVMKTYPSKKRSFLLCLMILFFAPLLLIIYIRLRVLIAFCEFAMPSHTTITPHDLRIACVPSLSLFLSLPFPSSYAVSP